MIEFPASFSNIPEIINYEEILTSIIIKKMRNILENISEK
mgnify:CR=1 FL=1